VSFILDALKKSEAERQRQAGPALLEMRVVAPQRRLPVWVVALGALLVLNVLGLSWYAWHLAAPASAPANPPALASGATSPVTASSAAATSAVSAAPASPAPVAVPAPATTQTSTAVPGGEGSDNAADLEPAVAPALRGAPDAQANRGLQNYTELSGKLPELRLDLHVYAANSADRYAFINMHRVHEGDVTPEGVQVRQITRDGVVLEYRGTGFFLGHD